MSKSDREKESGSTRSKACTRGRYSNGSRVSTTASGESALSAQTSSECVDDELDILKGSKKNHYVDMEWGKEDLLWREGQVT